MYIKTCSETIEADGMVVAASGLQKRCAFDLGERAELSLPSVCVHGATAPWGRS